MRTLSLLIIVVFAVTAIPTIGWAASPWTTEAENSGKMMGKLGFGVKNLLLGWTEIIRHPVKGVQGEGNKFEGFGKGLGTGLYHGLYDTVGGVLHVITFPFTNVDVPLPEDGVQLK